MADSPRASPPLRDNTSPLKVVALTPENVRIRLERHAPTIYCELSSAVAQRDYRHDRGTTERAAEIACRMGKAAIHLLSIAHVHSERVSSKVRHSKVKRMCALPAASDGGNTPTAPRVHTALSGARAHAAPCRRHCHSRVRIALVAVQYGVQGPRSVRRAERLARRRPRPPSRPSLPRRTVQTRARLGQTVLQRGGQGRGPRSVAFSRLRRTHRSSTLRPSLVFFPSLVASSVPSLFSLPLPVVLANGLARYALSLDVVALFLDNAAIALSMKYQVSSYACLCSHRGSALLNHTKPRRHQPSPAQRPQHAGRPSIHRGRRSSSGPAQAPRPPCGAIRLRRPDWIEILPGLSAKAEGRGRASISIARPLSTYHGTPPLPARYPRWIPSLPTAVRVSTRSEASPQACRSRHAT